MCRNAPGEPVLVSASESGLRLSNLHTREPLSPSVSDFEQIFLIFLICLWLKQVFLFS